MTKTYPQIARAIHGSSYGRLGKYKNSYLTYLKSQEFLNLHQRDQHHQRDSQDSKIFSPTLHPVKENLIHS